MINYVLEYLASKDIYSVNADEQNKLEVGINLWLLENGIRETDKDEYRKHYIVKVLEKISISDLKAYFMSYPTISDVMQIVFEFKEDGFVSNERKSELMESMKKLYDVGMGDKYIPANEVDTILSRT